MSAVHFRFALNVPYLFPDEGTLQLYQVGPANTVALMNATGDHGNLWHYWEANINSSSYFQVCPGVFQNKLLPEISVVFFAVVVVLNGSFLI